MYKSQKNHGRSFSNLIFLALLFFCIRAYPQYRTNGETETRITPEILNQTGDGISYVSTDTLSRLHSSVSHDSSLIKNKNNIFYDSLKVKASKYIITRGLYDFVIVSPDSADKKHITGTSDANYISYSGKKIRNIEIERLDVFGTDINNPVPTNPKEIHNLLNKTHLNTNETIIRKNLLFSEGDTISPLTLSDNERILRQLSFIDDARIIIVPVSDDEADILVITKDLYSLGASYSYGGLKKGCFSLFEKNIFGFGHELGIDVPWDSKIPNSPGFGAHYMINNIKKSFINLNLHYLNGLEEKTYGFSLTRNLISSATKYAGGISVRQMYTTEDLDNTLLVPQPFNYNLQDYWLMRSFLINKESVSRIIIGTRYTNNNVFNRPVILPNSYYHLQNYRIFLASAAFSIQKYYKTNLIYNFGRTEDIPYGGLIKFTAGKENNEFHKRTYLDAAISFGKSSKKLGYFYSSAGVSTFMEGRTTEQGLFSLNFNYFSNLINFRDNMVRNFVYINYNRGFDRNIEESLSYADDNGFSGFKNDSISGNQRLLLSVESVLFSPINFYGFRFAFFGFADFSLLSESYEPIGNGHSLTGFGMGIRIRNNNLVFNTFQVRIGFYPNPPAYSDINHFIFSGEQLLRPNNFDPGPPTVTPYL